MSKTITNSYLVVLDTKQALRLQHASEKTGRRIADILRDAVFAWLEQHNVPTFDLEEDND